MFHFRQACTDVAEGITDEDYDLFYEIWQEFDPKGTQYMSYHQLSEFLECLEPPLQVGKPNKYKIIKMDIPIIKFTNPNTGEVQEDCIFCADVLDILTQEFFSKSGDNPVMDEGPQAVEEVKVYICVFFYEYVNGIFLSNKWPLRVFNSGQEFPFFMLRSS